MTNQYHSCIHRRRAVVAVDTENRIMIMNPVAERLTGWNSSEAGGHYIHEVVRLFTAGTREPLKNPLQHVLDTGCRLSSRNIRC